MKGGEGKGGMGRKVGTRRGEGRKVGRERRERARCLQNHPHEWELLGEREKLCSPLPARSHKTKEYFCLKKCENCKTKKQPEKNKSKSKKKGKKKKKTKAKAKGTHKKQNFKSQSVFGCKSKYLTSCKQTFKLPAASKKNMEQKLIPSILTMIMI